MNNDQDQMTNEFPDRKAHFSDGDRVRMIRQADWKQDAKGTLVGNGQIRKGALGLYVDYFVAFDTPPSDLTDQMNGEPARLYSGSTVAESFPEQLPPGT